MKTDLADLPDDIRELIEPHAADNPETLDAISLSISQRRDEAKAARASSGIEQTWTECEEAYQGIDDANRQENQGFKWSKPSSPDGPVTTGRAPTAADHKSTVFIRLTARYVDAGAAKLGDILLPADDKAFSFSETPLPELIKAKDDTSQVVHDGLGNIPLTRPARPGEVPAQQPAPVAPTMAAQPISPNPGTSAAPPGSLGPGAAPAGGAVLSAGAAASPAAPPQVPLTVKDLAEETIEIARKKAKLAETRIYDWMVECQYQGEMRKVIFDAARIGVGVLKGPFPKANREIAVEQAEDGGIDMEIQETVKPSVRWADPWNIFPDPACGENIHFGDFVFERDYLSARQIRDLKKIPGYIAAQIDKVLEEGPDKVNTSGDEGISNGQGANQKKNRFEVWYYYGSLKREELGAIWAAAGKTLGEADVSPEKKEVYAIVTLVNTCVIRATINPLDSGAFPYHSVPWQRRSGHWAGLGVAEQLKMPQRTINAATRAMLNNAGKSAGMQYVIDQSAITPANGSWVIEPDKIWYKTGDALGQPVGEVFMAVVIPNVTDALMKIIEYAQQLAEESTSIPLITQGQSGATTPDTFGATQLQNNNANQLLRSIGYAFDDYITEPVVRQFYEWLLLDPEVPNDEKGDFTINAHGSVALVERAIQNQAIAQMGPLVLNPAYGFDPKKWAKLQTRANRLDPADLQYTDEQQAKMDATPPTPAPAVQVAQIQADVAMKQLVATQQGDQRSLQNEQQIAQGAQALEGQRVQNEQHRTLTEATVKLHELENRRQLAMLDYANKHSINLDQVKAALAKTAMTLDTQKQLNAADNAVDLHKHHNPPPQARQPKAVRPQRSTPPLSHVPDQVPGRAGDGRAFEQAR